MTECWRISTRSRVAISSALRSGRTLNADDDRVGRRGQEDVGFVDRAHAGVNDANLDLFVRQLGQRIGQHFGGALHVRFDDHRQFFDATLGDLRLERFECEAAALCAERPLLGLRLAERGDLPGLCSVGEGLERISRLRQPRQTEHFDRYRWPCRFTGRPRSSMSARTRPTIGPAMKVSPTCSVPS